ncbi:hypothetical protein BU24DRAFT_401833 [Aaosphaeria arxii CBS 175.79]|uniref:protein-tyrosine-phosphatase n=1 Tax=Aaosphaeria arxii CBS 175.79 TaxID=1450172 RepID=A0A6A5X8D9_9PLEO|nr:uncharacterized protein BU24DRAFT_401833 [Aaosphaeria arxii CBS 175.79]KAF2009170.1 hypothetical protein BU24DRAFT_401833 [Aaosphaeria arxii CBS 175.79]
MAAATTTATATFVHETNTTLKRSYAPDLAPNTSCFPSKPFESVHQHKGYPTYIPSKSLRGPPSQSHRLPRLAVPQTSSWIPRTSMVQTSTRPMPSFMSVFGEDASTTGIKESVHGGAVARPASSGNITHGSTSSNAHYSGFHVHRDSTSTLASESSDNSPTTTISTMDSSSATEISPGPSPESPSSRVMASAFSADFRSRKTDNASLDNSPTTFFELQRPVTPAKKPRNLKNLGINTTSSLGNLRNNATASLPAIAPKEKNTSAPASPSFIKPPTPPKRRPSNLSLTIQTPGSDTKPTRLIIPSTPAMNRPALRHFQSSPSLPLCSPSVVPSGGMRLPALRPIKTNPHGFAEVPVEIEEEDQEPNFDVPQSREEKPAAYPNGPICIYESGVYLYFEPTAEQAREFDVIVNVASEVKNPFTHPVQASQKDLDARRIDGPPAENVDFAAIPERANKSSFDVQNNSPTTPKATPSFKSIAPSFELDGNGKPEYIHMPWEHNTDIVPDLYKLVKTMDERVQQRKRILVHCQCGVSRSASLIVAYGLYKNPGISVQEAYDAVKKRSKWIGPNMNLIMQLQEFRNGLMRANEGRHTQGFGLPRRSAGLATGVSNVGHRSSPFDREATTGSRTPRTAPLPPESDISLQRASTGSMMAIPPGPLSAPSGVFYSADFRRSWGSSQTNFDLSPKSSPKSTAYVDPKGQVVPVLSITENDASATFDQSANTKESAKEKQAAVEPRPVSVPNFSRVLPLRNSMLNGDSHLPKVQEASQNGPFLAAPEPPSISILSPTTSTFQIPTIPHTEQANMNDLRSPMRTQFNMNPWPRSGSSDMTVPSSPPSYEDPMSPRSTGFQLAGFSMVEPDGLMSPRATAFDLPPAPVATNDEPSHHFDVISPIKTEFPKDMFPPTTSAAETDVASPRSTDFHMTPIKPQEANEDPFGLTSPKHFEFPSSVHDDAKTGLEEVDESTFRRPSFQAILPPSGLTQPESTNGPISLNGIAHAQPLVVLPKSSSNETPKTPEVPRMDSLSNFAAMNGTDPLEPQTPEFPSPLPARTPESQFLTTPSKKLGIRTRFSSPNLREQRRLQKLQTEMEAMLPQKAPVPTQSADDLDALMSPRAEEFTRNPFHLDLQKPTSNEDVSPASSTETIKENHVWKETQHFTPQKVAQDPRSPVQTGSSPIVRNIWDVL